MAENFKNILEKKEHEIYEKYTNSVLNHPEKSKANICKISSINLRSVNHIITKYNLTDPFNEIPKKKLSSSTKDKMKVHKSILSPLNDIINDCDSSPEQKSDALNKKEEYKIKWSNEKLSKLEISKPSKTSRKSKLLKSSGLSSSLSQINELPEENKNLFKGSNSSMIRKPTLSQAEIESSYNSMKI